MDNNMWETIKSFCRDRHNQRKFLQISVFITAVALGSLFFFVRPDNDMMNGVKYFSAAVGKMDTVKVSKYLSVDTQPEISSKYNKFYNTQHIAAYYEAAYKNFSFMIGDTYIKNDAGTVKIQFSVPNFKLSFEKIFPDGVSQWLGENPTFDDLCSDKSKPIFEKLTKALETEEIAFSKTTFDFDTKKSGDVWGVTLTAETLDGITGFLISSIVSK